MGQGRKFQTRPGGRHIVEPVSPSQDATAPETAQRKTPAKKSPTQSEVSAPSEGDVVSGDHPGPGETSGH